MISVHLQGKPLNITVIQVYTPRKNAEEAEAPTLWLPDDRNLLIGKDPDAEKDWRQEEKGMTEDEMAG